MSKQKLKNIAQGLLSSFLSRNNDVNGYWGIGKIYALMLQKNTNGVVIDLIEKTIVPNSDEFIYRISKYSEKLMNQLRAQSMDEAFLKSAKLNLACSDLNLNRFYLNTLICKLVITDKNNRNHIVKKEVLCRKHNPKSELKRG
ncbi:hypothetical protein [Winogradskyella sp.]|uniref:hypothetical protein n=1 Tax=Winogradskyella sp. TaxID=1883156 RepID=UPI003BAD1997